MVGVFSRAGLLAALAVFVGLGAGAVEEVVVPDGYERLAGVRATQNQCLDTGYLPKSASVYSFEFSLNVKPQGKFVGEWRGVFGNHCGENNDATRLICWASSDSDFAFNNLTRASDGVQISQVNTAQGQRVTGWMDSEWCALSGGQGVERKVALSGAAGEANDYSLLLFVASHSANQGAAEVAIYRFRIEEKIANADNVVVHDYLPVRRLADNAVGFYDLAAEESGTKFLYHESVPLEAIELEQTSVEVVIRNRFGGDRMFSLSTEDAQLADAAEATVVEEGKTYRCLGYRMDIHLANGGITSASSTDRAFNLTLPSEARRVQVIWNWVLAELPSVPDGYVRIDYLEAQGGPYLDTMHTVTTNTEFRFKYAMQTGVYSYAGAFGTYNSESANCTRIIAHGVSTSDWLVNFMNIAQEAGSPSIRATVNSMDVVEGWMNADAVCLNGVLAAQRGVNGVVAADASTVRIFNSVSIVNHTTRFWSMQIFEHGVLIHDYVPYEDGDGEGVMYDRIAGVSLRNAAGSGQFVCGPRLDVSVSLTAEANGPGGVVAVVCGGAEANGRVLPFGSTVTVTATPSAGYEFLGWTGMSLAAVTAPTFNFALDDGKAHRVQAIFRRQNWSRVVPANYTRLCSVKTTRTQVFDTRFYPCPGTRMDAGVRLSGEFDNDGNRVFCGCREPDFYFLAYAMNGVGANKTVGVALGAAEVYRQFDGGDVQYGENAVFRLDSTLAMGALGYLSTPKEEVVAHYYAASFFIAGETNAVDGVVKPTSICDLEIHDWRIYVYDMPVRDYVACRDPNGVAGLYDTVGERFYAPMGGAVVSGEVWSGAEWTKPSKVLRLAGNNEAMTPAVSPSCSDLTLNLWVKNAQVNDASGNNYWEGAGEYYGALVYQGGFNQLDGFIVYVASNVTAAAESSMELRFMINCNHNEQNLSVNWVRESRDDQWHMVTATYDRTAQVARIYVDGVLRAERTGVVASNPLTAESMIIGGSRNYHFYGRSELAELSVWDRALGEREVKRLRFGPLSGEEQDLVMYYSLTDGSALPLDLVAWAAGRLRMGSMSSLCYDFVEDWVRWANPIGTMIIVR